MASLSAIPFIFNAPAIRGDFRRGDSLEALKLKGVMLAFCLRDHRGGNVDMLLTWRGYVSILQNLLSITANSSHSNNCPKKMLTSSNIN